MIEGDDIRQTRLSRGMSQKELADFLGTTQKMISFWERNIFDPHRHNERMLRDWIAGKLKPRPKRKESA